MKLIRVPYGKKNTPKDMREYKLEGTGTVGTLAEFKKVYPKKKFTIIDVINK